MTTDCLRNRVKNIECLEIDPALANSLGHRLLNSNVHVQQGDATAMPYSDCSFSAVVSFTMLHHVPSLALQNQLFTECIESLGREGFRGCGQPAIHTHADNPLGRYDGRRRTRHPAWPA